MRIAQLIITGLVIAALLPALPSGAVAGVNRIVIRVDGLSCPFCGYSLEKQIKRIDAVGNLATAGRCASATHEGCASVRLQTHCMVMGQGIGTAAAIALETGVGLADVPAGELQKVLN